MVVQVKLKDGRSESSSKAPDSGCNGLEVLNVPRSPDFDVSGLQVLNVPRPVAEQPLDIAGHGSEVLDVPRPADFDGSGLQVLNEPQPVAQRQAEPTKRPASPKRRPETGMETGHTEHKTEHVETDELTSTFQNREQRKVVRNLLKRVGGVASNLYAKTKESNTLVKLGVSTVEYFASPAANYAATRLEAYADPLVSSIDDRIDLGYERLRILKDEIQKPPTGPQLAFQATAGSRRNRRSSGRSPSPQASSSSHASLSSPSQASSVPEAGFPPPFPVSRPQDFGFGESVDSSVAGLPIAHYEGDYDSEDSDHCNPQNLTIPQQSSLSSYLWHRFKTGLLTSRWSTGVDQAAGDQFRECCEDDEQETPVPQPHDLFFNTAQDLFMRSYENTVLPIEHFADSLRHRLGPLWDDRLSMPANVFFTIARAIHSVVHFGYLSSDQVRQHTRQRIYSAFGLVLEQWEQIMHVAEAALDRWMPLYDQDVDDEGHLSDDMADSRPPLERDSSHHTNHTNHTTNHGNAEPRNSDTETRNPDDDNSNQNNQSNQSNHSNHSFKSHHSKKSNDDSNQGQCEPGRVCDFPPCPAPVKRQSVSNETEWCGLQGSSPIPIPKRNAGRTHSELEGYDTDDDTIFNLEIPTTLAPLKR